MPSVSPYRLTKAAALVRDGGNTPYVTSRIVIDPDERVHSYPRAMAGRSVSSLKSEGEASCRLFPYHGR